MIKKNILFITAILIFISFSPSISYSTESNIVKTYNQGLQKEQQGELYSALFVYQKVLKENPYFVDALISLSRVYYKLKDYLKAKKTVEKALYIEEKNTTALNLLGRIYTETKEYTRAEELFKKILKLNPPDIQARYGLARVYTLQHRYEEAISIYRYILKINPRDSNVYMCLGDIYLKMKKYKKAGSLYRNALSLDSHNPQTHIKIARYYFFMGKLYSKRDEDVSNRFLKAAIDEIKTALEIKNNSTDALETIGDVYLYKKDYSSALKYYTSLTGLKPDDYIVLYSTGLCYEMLGDLHKAKVYYMKALVNRRDDEITRFRLENVVRNLYREDLKNSLRKELSEYHFDKGKFYFNKNFLGKAYHQYRRAVQLDPLNPSKRLALAEIFRIQRYYARYLYELKNIIRDTLDVNTTDINDKIEILENMMMKSLPARWKVKPYLEDKSSPYYVPKTRCKIAVLNSFVSENSNEMHRIASITFQDMLSYLLSPEPKIEIVSTRKEATTQDEALNLAKKLSSDFYTTAVYVETSDSIKINLELRASNNGEIIKNYSVIATGNDKVFNSFFSLASNIVNTVPLYGMIVKIEGDRVLINIGKRHGVEKGMSFIITRKGKYNPAVYYNIKNMPEENILGKVKITEADELVSEGKYEFTGNFNRVNIYDTVVFVKEKTEINSDTNKKTKNK